MDSRRRGHRELEHTADWALEVWAPDMAALLEEAALGMYELMGVGHGTGPRCRRRVVIEGADRETIIVELLSDLLYLLESEGLAFDRLNVSEESGRLVASLEGAPVRTPGKEVKAVTYHALEIRDTPQGVATTIVFDV